MNKSNSFQTKRGGDAVRQFPAIDTGFACDLQPGFSQHRGGHQSFQLLVAFRIGVQGDID